jgi:hypothetical protein
MSLNIHLRFHEPLLNEGTGFRYHLLLENTSTQTLFLDPVTHLPFKITELEEKKPLLPQIDYWIEPLFPEHLLPKSTFRAEGELLTHFLFKPHHHYEVTLALKGFFPKGKKKKASFLLASPSVYRPSPCRSSLA